MQQARRTTRPESRSSSTGAPDNVGAHSQQLLAAANVPPTILAGCFVGAFVVLASAALVMLLPSACRAVDFACTGTPAQNAADLCDGGASQNPCIISDPLNLPERCELDFGDQDVVLRANLTVSAAPGSCFLACQPGTTRVGERCTSHNDCPCAPGESCPAARCASCFPLFCSECCNETFGDVCGGVVDIAAGSLTVECGRKLSAPGPSSAPADSDAAGGVIRITARRDILVRGLVEADGRNYGGTIYLLPDGNFRADAAGTCKGTVSADGTKLGTEDEADGGSGGDIVIGEGFDTDVAGVASITLANGATVRAEGSKFGSGGGVAMDTCGAISIDAASRVGTIGSNAELDGGGIELVTDTLVLGGTVDAGDGGVVELHSRSVQVTGAVNPAASCVSASCQAPASCNSQGVCVDPALICCGNARIDPPEQCDDGIDPNDPSGTCDDSNDPPGSCPCECRAPFCGDGLRNSPSEQCDGADFGTATCANLGFDGGPLTCRQDCTRDTSSCAICGNGRRDPGEQCDGVDLGGASCESLGFTGGSLSCRGPSDPLKCRFSTSGCSVCGNGMIEPGEVCDGTNLGGATCQSRGYPGGTLACASGCRAFDERGCFVCGNGRREGAEQCDSPDLGGATCNAPGETGGVPSCTSTCQLDRSTCFVCGNGRTDPGEECDDGNGQTGDGCRPNCTSECGNGSVEGVEECDDGNRTWGDGCSGECAFEEVFGGSGALQDCALEWLVRGGPPSRRQECRDGDPVCDRGSVAGECTFEVFFCFNWLDIVIGGLPDCSPRNIARVALRTPSLIGSRALSPTDIDAILGPMSAALAEEGVTVTRGPTALDVSPPAQGRYSCGKATMRVPLRRATAGFRPSRRLLSIEAIDASGIADRDTLTFLCNP